VHHPTFHYSREEAGDEYGDDADEGHDDRIEILKNTEQTMWDRIGHLKGEYTYDDEQQSESEPEAGSGDEQKQESAVGESSDMDLESVCDQIGRCLEGINSFYTRENMKQVCRLHRNKNLRNK